MYIRLVRSLLFVVILLAVCAQAFGFALSFDDIPTGQSLEDYWVQFGAGFDSSFTVADHSLSSWGSPHSGNNVLTFCRQWGASASILKFASHYPGPLESFSIFSLGAYFSTERGTVVQLTGYHGDMSHPVASLQIGAADTSWNNVYASLSSPTGNIDFIMFQPIIPAESALLHFCADDMTIRVVPEPSSLLALAGGLAAMGIGWSRRKAYRS